LRVSTSLGEAPMWEEKGVTYDIGSNLKKSEAHLRSHTSQGCSVLVGAEDDDEFVYD